MNCCGEAINITYLCVCVCAHTSMHACAWVRVHVALLIQHTTCMLHIVTSFLAPLAAPYFLTLSHKRHDFRKIVVEHKMCFSFLYNFCLKHLSL